MKNIIEKLKISSTLTQLPGISTSEELILSEKEKNQLMGYASILSLSDSAEDKTLSYEIITRLIELGGVNKDNLLNFAEVIMSRLGNFPARQLLQQRFDYNNKNKSSYLKLECLSREIENSIFINDEAIKLTDFQYNFFSSLNNEKTLSISAPTSAGKSFVLSLNLVNKIQKNNNQCIVYIVPTRALISEVSNRIREALRKYDLDDVIIRTAPFPISKEKAKLGVIYVLTQERLMNFLFEQKDNTPTITSLIVDEAHEIQNGNRGILLQSAIDFLIKSNPHAEILFASPLIKNPGYFLNIFNKLDNGKFFTETISPVAQNIILIDEVHRSPREAKFELLEENKKLPLGIRKLDFKLRNNKAAQRAKLAYSISKNKESVIIFSNGPADAEKVAAEVRNCVNDFTITKDIEIFIDFIAKEIHPDYPLINCLKSGVGFHYGKMPSIVRTGVENLFKSEQIKFICCTSTLLQGVNLPAKHIIIENPMSGTSPMSRANFLNLSGRAGRLLKEFHGNIWCIRPGSWDTNSYEGEKLQEITSAISSIMNDGGKLIQDLLNDTISKKFVNDAEVALVKIFQDYHYSDSGIEIESYRNTENSESLDKTLEAISSIKTQLPQSIIEKHKSIRPDYLQRLFDVISKNASLDNYLLINPHTSGANIKMKKAIGLFNSCFNLEFSEPYINLINSLAYNWAWGKSLSEILHSRVSYVKSKNIEMKTSEIIREYLDVLDNEIRFKLVKYFSAYNDILKYVMIERKIIDVELEPYHIYLEFGTCNKDALNIMATGLSRFTALHLLKVRNIIPKTNDLDDYYSKIKLLDVSKLNIPSLCKQEIQSMQGIIPT